MVVEATPAERRACVRRLRLRGHTLRQVATAYGLSVERVRQLSPDVVRPRGSRVGAGSRDHHVPPDDCDACEVRRLREAAQMSLARAVAAGLVSSVYVAHLMEHGHKAVPKAYMRALREAAKKKNAGRARR